MRKLTEIIRKTAWGKRVLEDPLFRVYIISAGSMGWNLIYALFNGVLAVVYHSFWFLSMFAYYAVLGGMRLLVVSPKKGRARERWTLRVMMRALGIGMIFLAIVISGIVCMTVAEKHNPSYHMVVMLAIAAYTFYTVIMSVLNTVKAHRRKEIRMILLRNISLSAAIAAILSLERSMLGTFGSAEDRFTKIMEAASGAVAFVLMTGIAVSMIVQSRQTEDSARQDAD